MLFRSQPSGKWAFVVGVAEYVNLLTESLIVMLAKLTAFANVLGVTDHFQMKSISACRMIDATHAVRNT